MKIDRRLIENFDFALLAMVVILSVAGILTIYSATRPVLGEQQPDFYLKQTYWLLVGIAGLLLAISMDYNRLKAFSIYLYLGSLILLLAVLFAGKSGMGAQRWLRLGPFGFQPSELFKISMVLSLSLHLSEIRGTLSFKSLIRSFAIYALPGMVLLIKQPDLGTALVVVFVFFTMVFSKGIEKRLTTLLIIVGLISVPFLGSITWDNLKEYQKQRILAFIDPSIDPDGISYHINQSKIAVGSGRIFGKGYLKGTQGPFRFLPEKHTDFVFSIFAEEWGFAGSMFILLVYVFFIFRGLEISGSAKDQFGSMLALGITYMFAFYIVINIGMTLGLTPVVGIPLPFMSYGGTALFTNFIAAGLLASIRSRRFELFY